MNFEKPPEGGGLSGLIRNSPESARLLFHCRPRNQGKGRELVKVYNITHFKNIFSATGIDFKKRRRGVDHVNEFEIVPNRHVLVFIVSREIEEKVPLKLLILTPPAKIVDNCLPLGFHRQFFLCMRP